MPPGVKDAGITGNTLWFQKDDGNWVDQDEARKQEITHSTLPQKNKK